VINQIVILRDFFNKTFRELEDRADDPSLGAMSRIKAHWHICANVFLFKLCHSKTFRAIYARSVLFSYTYLIEATYNLSDSRCLYRELRPFKEHISDAFCRLLLEQYQVRKKKKVMDIEHLISHVLLPCHLLQSLHHLRTWA
jgi:hypothetical protein